MRISRDMKTKGNDIVIVGAGPSGLGCAYELRKHTIFNLTLLDRNDKVGGLARSYDFKGHVFDIGPHRFYTKNNEVLALWKKILGKDLIEVTRLTRSMYKNKLFLYPVKFSDALAKLGVVESIEGFLSFLKAKVSMHATEPKTFEEWVTKQFGKKLYEIVFKTYTEKVWGISCDKIGAEWAAQRIKHINLLTVLKNGLFASGGMNTKSWVERFLYPKFGAGQLYETMAKKIQKSGGAILLEAKVIKIHHENYCITGIEYLKKGKKFRRHVGELFSSMPLTSFIEALDPQSPAAIKTAAKKLYFRDHITVNMIVNKPDVFPDNWIYVYSPEVKMARVVNYSTFTKNKSETSAIAVEYFVFKNDELWKRSDDELIGLAKKELDTVGLVRKQDMGEAFVIRETESYPTYYLGHRHYFDQLKAYVSRFENLQLIGRGGMYKYDNMDHALYSGMLAARNYVAGKRIYDVWKINEDAEYLEK